METVGVEGRSDVPSVESMGVPGATGFRFVMDDDVCAGGSKGGAVKIKGSIYLGVGR